LPEEAAGNHVIMKRNQQKRLGILPRRHANGSKRQEEPKSRKRAGWMRDEELDRSINAAVQDSDNSRER
jgi:hypothetical protein